MNKQLLNKVSKLTTESAAALIYTDHLTGALNRRAFDELATDTVTVAIIDLDSLKYVNDHHSMKHRAGDCLICFLANCLIGQFGHDNVFRMGGDEFAVISTNGDSLVEHLINVRRLIPIFSMGVGATLDSADDDLTTDKNCNIKDGTRAKRGVKPVWFERLSEWF